MEVGGRVRLRLGLLMLFSRMKRPGMTPERAKDLAAQAARKATKAKFG